MPDKRDLLLAALRRYKTNDVSEKNFIRETITFIEENPNCFERTNVAGHVTGSAWVLSPDGEKALLTHHKKLNRWLQLGGHSDGDPDTWHVALREATEESGIQNCCFVTKDIFDIDIHVIPENPQKGESAHTHYDVRFLLKAPTENFIVSAESNRLKWVTVQELDAMGKAISPAMRRMINKWQHLKR